jgi:hypothetical protein
MEGLEGWDRKVPEGVVDGRRVTAWWGGGLSWLWITSGTGGDRVKEEDRGDGGRQVSKHCPYHETDR